MALLGGWYFMQGGWFVHNAKILSIIITTHALYSVIHAVKFLISEYRASGYLSEITMQLIYMTAIPNVIFFAAFATSAWSPNNILLITMLLIFEGVLGLLFSISHDKTWIWRLNGLARWKRDVICLLPHIGLMFGLLTLS
uniref:Uncharacterized protein n=1 Tax=Candidatus Kentrum sp. LPFa TaxID=2126335 RepID=A0A450XGT1_9GAMM|nr:MAG: hypothetical protein BECKLPF1236A_GA0070988_100343 [Candidatus Kentron sp. LPFa]VFK28459.1 MAG: hypothetical protein BECKLPF1236C_GA0070990_100653 [Candidatus Kentron sp. LPFa]